MLGDADVVVIHGGVGTIRAALSMKKRVVVVPRRSIYGEHVDDHQMEIVSAFAEGGYVAPCYDLNCLSEAIRDAARRSFSYFDPMPCTIEEEISKRALDWGFKIDIQEEEKLS